MRTCLKIRLLPHSYSLPALTNLNSIPGPKNSLNLKVWQWLQRPGRSILWNYVTIVFMKTLQTYVCVYISSVIESVTVLAQLGSADCNNFRSFAMHEPLHMLSGKLVMADDAIKLS